MLKLRLLRGLPWLTAVSGMLAGVAVGVAVFAAGKLTGFSLAALVGGFVGLVLAPIFRAYSSTTVQLKDVKIRVPQFGEAVFVVAQDTEAQAYRLYVELSTRVATRPLRPDTGLVEDAIGSLYTLFTVARAVVTEARVPRKTGSAPTVRELGTRMLNWELEPFLSYWHATLQRWQQEHPGEYEDAWPANAQFRAELAQLQPKMREYMLGFARLAGLSAESLELTEPANPFGAGLPPARRTSPESSQPEVHTRDGRETDRGEPKRDAELG